MQVREYDLCSISELEAVPTKEILRQGLQAKDFAWDVHDTEQVLRLKYIYSEHGKLYKADKTLVSNFAEFTVEDLSSTLE